MEPGAIGALTLSGELNSNDPIESILNIQKQLMVEDGKIEAVFQLLDKCGVSRAEVYSRILNNLTNSLKDQINWKNYFNTEILFKEMLPYNRFSEVRDILSKLIKESPKLSSELILAIGKYPNLIDVCPLAVRQEIWENKEEYLIEKVNEEIENHFKDISVGLEITVSVYDDTKLIMPCRIANKLKEYSDGHPKLVKTILHCIRTKFVETEDTRCCLLYRDYIRNLNCEDYIYAVKLISLINNLKDCMNKNTLIPEKIEEIMKQIEPYTEYITPEEFAKSLFDYIEKLIEHDKSNFFLYPVTELICKGYRKEIREPMDYHTLESKLLTNKYFTFEDFKHDLDLIYSNSRRYNARTPDLFTYTCREEDYAKTELDKIKKAKDPSYLVDMIMIIMCPYYINMIINYLILYLNGKTKEVNYDINNDKNIDCANYLLLFQSIWKPIISASIIQSQSHDYSEYIKILSTKDYQFYDAFRLQIRGYIVDDLTSDHEQIIADAVSTPVYLKLVLAFIIRIYNNNNFSEQNTEYQFLHFLLDIINRNSGEILYSQIPFFSVLFGIITLKKTKKDVDESLALFILTSLNTSCQLWNNIFNSCCSISLWIKNNLQYDIKSLVPEIEKIGDIIQNITIDDKSKLELIKSLELDEHLALDISRKRKYSEIN